MKESTVKAAQLGIELTDNLQQLVLSGELVDDIPLNKVYENLNKRLSPSLSTKPHKKPDNDTFVPMYPSVEERIHDMQHRRIKACVKLPDNHPIKPPMIEPLQFVLADAEVVDDHTGLEYANHEVSLSPSEGTTHSSEPSVLENLVNHYSSELPGYETNLERASDLAYDEVMTENPQQQAPNSEMASLSSTNSVTQTNQHVPEQTVSKQTVFGQHVPEQTVPEQHVIEQVIVDQSSETNSIFVEPKISTNDQPSSSNLALQTCSPPRTTNIPSPPTLFLDSTIFTDVCENIFQELNKLIRARNNLVHEECYEKKWRRLRERVDFVLSELQRSSIDAQDTAQKNLQDWLRGVVNNMQEVAVSRTLVNTPLCLSGRDVANVIPTCVYPKELNLDWLNKINFKSASTYLELLQRNTVLERENKQLRKELLDQKLLLLEYKTSTKAKLEEARIREENLLRSNEEFKKEIKQEVEETNKLLKQMMEMFQSQAKP